MPSWTGARSAQKGFIQPMTDRGCGEPASWHKKSPDYKALRGSLRTLGPSGSFAACNSCRGAAQKRGDPGDPGETVNESDLFFLCLAELQPCPGLLPKRSRWPRPGACPDCAPAAMADHLMLAEGYCLLQVPPHAHGPHAPRTLQPYPGPGMDSGLRPRGAPLGPPPPPGTLAYGSFGSPVSFQPFPVSQSPGAGSTHLQSAGTPSPGRIPASPAAAGGPSPLQPAPGAASLLPPPPPPPALGCMDAELIDEEALTSLELELGLHRVRELPELFLGQSEFDCFSDLGSAPAAGSVSC